MEPLTPDQEKPSTAQTPKSPDDQGIVHLDGYIKIFDPNTGKILVEARE